MKNVMDEYYDDEYYDEEYYDEGEYYEEGQQVAYNEEGYTLDEYQCNVEEPVEEEIKHERGGVRPKQKQEKKKKEEKKEAPKPKAPKKPKKKQEEKKELAPPTPKLKKQASSNREITHAELNEIYPIHGGEEVKAKDNENLNLCIIGHVDSGKSTLTGNLLALQGHLSKQELHRNKREADLQGKGTFHHAYVMDQDEDEREKGVTINTGHANFKTKKRPYTILDNPGHKDFIANMITGTVQADCAILVIDSDTGAFEKGFNAGGQTAEHALLAHSLGISHIVVVLNKLENVEWSEERYIEIEIMIKEYLIQTVKYREDQIDLLPISGMEGINLIKRADKSHPLSSWYDGPHLLEVLDSLTPAPKMSERPLRISVTEVFKSLDGTMVGDCVNAKVESGYVGEKEKLMLMPHNEKIQIKAMTINTKKVRQCKMGDICCLSISLPGGFDPGMISAGDVICDQSFRIKYVDRLICTLSIFNVETPIMKGHKVTVHSYFTRVPGRISKLIEVIDSTTGETLKRNPMAVKKGQTVRCLIKLDECGCFELHSNFDKFGSVVLRDNKTTVGKGVITEFPKGTTTKIKLDDTQRMEAC